MKDSGVANLGPACKVELMGRFTAWIGSELKIYLAFDTPAQCFSPDFTTNSLAADFRISDEAFKARLPAYSWPHNNAECGSANNFTIEASDDLLVIG